MSGFNPMDMLGGFMNAIPSASNNNPFGMISSLLGGMGNYASASEDPSRQAQGEKLNSIMPFIQSLGATVGQMSQPWQNDGPPIQGQGWGPAGIPGFRGNNYGVGGGTNAPSQEIISLLSGLMNGSFGSQGQPHGTPGFNPNAPNPQVPVAPGAPAAPQHPMGYDMGANAGQYIRNRLGGLFGSRGAAKPASPSFGSYGPYGSDEPIY